MVRRSQRAQSAANRGQTGAKGDTGAQGIQGERGLTGQDGISPTVTITNITGGHRITITDKDGEHSADVMDGTGSVGDVQINGTSIVQGGVANVPVATASRLGVVYVAGGGLAVDPNTGRITTQRSTENEIKAWTNTQKPTVPINQHQSTFYGLAKAAGDTTQSQSSNPVGTYTEDAKTAIRTMLGIDKESLIAEIRDALNL